MAFMFEWWLMHLAVLGPVHTPSVGMPRHTHTPCLNTTPRRTAVYWAFFGAPKEDIAWTQNSEIWQSIYQMAVILGLRLLRSDLRANYSYPKWCINQCHEIDRSRPSPMIFMKFCCNSRFRSYEWKPRVVGANELKQTQTPDQRLVTVTHIKQGFVHVYGRLPYLHICLAVTCRLNAT